MSPKLAPFLSLAGAAKVVKRTPGVITRAVAAGRLPHYITECGKIKLISRPDVLKWAKDIGRGNRKSDSNLD